MNIQGRDILLALREAPYASQRLLAEASGHSLGVVNRCLKRLTADGYLDKHAQLTEKSYEEFSRQAPKSAVILAAGFGLRMVPINMETSKAFLEVGGEPLIERLIKQLHEVDIQDIYIVVGYRKEQFEYLIDDYGVQLIVNPNYAEQNNLHSLALAAEHLSNSYVLPCDLWCAQNPFHVHELYSWYMVSEAWNEDSTVRVNRKGQLTTVPEGAGGNAMIGIAYLPEEQAAVVRERLSALCRDKRSRLLFWEAALYDKGKLLLNARVAPAGQVVEINTYEQLRELDGHSGQLKSDKMQVIESVLQAKPEEITDISALKKGMTNRSFLFSCRGKRYIMRIPGEGTGQLINRREEAAVYRLIQGRDLCEDVLYIDPGSGYKLSRFLEGARTCDPLNGSETAACMKKLRCFHEMELSTDHEFDLFSHIEFYERLWNGQPSAYRSYRQTKANILRLKPFIDAQAGKKVLTHIDAVPDNFLFFQNGQGKEDIRLIDWEYAAMQDPHVDIAMFCIYAMYDRAYVDRLIDQYFTEGCTLETRIKIYCYIAVCGLLWSNWCEYKRSLGVEFGAYSLRQYRYARDYYRIAAEKLGQTGVFGQCTP